ATWNSAAFKSGPPLDAAARLETASHRLPAETPGDSCAPLDWGSGDSPPEAIRSSSCWSSVAGSVERPDTSPTVDGNAPGPNVPCDPLQHWEGGAVHAARRAPESFVAHQVVSTARP